MAIESNGNSASEKADLWSLVISPTNRHCFQLFGETSEARKERYSGKKYLENVEFITEFGPEESRLINKLRENEADYAALIKIISVTHRESTSWQSARD